MNKLSSIAFFSGISVLAVCIAASAVEISGVIEGSRKWTAEESPYILTGDILIPEKARLSIGPGTKIIAGKQQKPVKGIEQADRLDSFTVAIHVKGVLLCTGRPDERISFSGDTAGTGQCSWYGIILDGTASDQSRLTFTDISGSCNGLSVRKGAPQVHHCIFEKNNIGIIASDASRIKIANCVIAGNSTAGIRVTMANPVVYSSIIMNNGINGLWSDGASHITFENNLVFRNFGENFSGCDPELGILTRVNENKDSVDAFHNLYEDPVFIATEAESLAMERDSRLPPRKSQVKDTAVAKALAGSVSDTLPFTRTPVVSARYKPSRYSPCINAGFKSKDFNDLDKSRNDIGIYGGPEFYNIE
jgi:hypothetical protein